MIWGPKRIHRSDKWIKAEGSATGIRLGTTFFLAHEQGKIVGTYRLQANQKGGGPVTPLERLPPTNERQERRARIRSTPARHNAVQFFDQFQ